MTLDEMKSTFEKYNEDEFLVFEKVENKLSQRPDLHAFILLDRLAPSKHDMIAGAEHDEIYLESECNVLASVITEEQIIELIRCGVMYDWGNESLHMYA